MSQSASGAVSPREPVDPADWPASVEALGRTPGTPTATATAPALAELTTLRVGGPVGDYVETTSEAGLIDAVRQADADSVPLLVIGGGSNILAADAGFEGVVVRDARAEVDLVTDDLVRRAVASHWGGFAALSGIPGTVGAAPVQNIGAYGAEVAELLASVRAWDRAAGRTVHIPLSELRLTYRDSALKRSLTDPDVGAGRTWGPTGRWVVLSVTFHVHRASLSAPIAYSQLAGALDVEMGARVDAREVREAVLALRRSKGMVLDAADHDTWSAGSFFTHPILTSPEAAALPEDAPRFPVADRARAVAGTRGAPVVDGLVKTSAAWLIDHAGFSKGFTAPGTRGRASLSTKHVLALTNRGGATAADVVALRDAIVEGVRERYGVVLVPEPVAVGW